MTKRLSAASYPRRNMASQSPCDAMTREAEACGGKPTSSLSPQQVKDVVSGWEGSYPTAMRKVQLYYLLLHLYLTEA
ncbi:unnamed protein product [Linum tenue]|uniref:Uncharacterized protein n=1 Tax=Linum tenue TaxID=586396 RepID=A0AAV0M244_9ROSI|nr:unnamed protein product [Linum tenue]